MAYNQFTVDDLQRLFKVTIREGTDHFSGVSPVTLSEVLRTSLNDGAPIALELSTEKARSEWIIAPILLELRRQVNGAVGLFSGVDFTVDSEQGLNGFCDWLISRSSSLLTIQAPVVAIVEAKNENIRAGIPQCVAEMYAASRFNAAREVAHRFVHGVVTTGSVWRFLRLEGSTVDLDRKEYYLDEVDRIVGVLKHMVTSS